MMKKINKPVIAITTSTKGAGKSAVTLTYATYFKNKNIPLIVATYPEFNGKFDSSITHSVIKTEEDIKNSPFVIESSEFKPYLSLNIPVYVGIDYTTLNNTKTEIVIWGICKGSTEPPLIKPDVYITVVDLGREAWDYISYPGIYNLRNSHIIFLNKANIFKNSLKEQLIMQELKEINPNAEIIKVRQVEIGDDTSIVVPEDEKINIYEILGCYIKGI
ncbi:MAG: hypothetical protein QXP34_00425 [Candidatus Aenigmatarchaeota archaeon]